MLADKHVLMSFWRRAREACRLSGARSPEAASWPGSALNRELKTAPAAPSLPAAAAPVPGAPHHAVQGVGAGRGLASRKGSHTGSLPAGPPSPARLSSQPDLSRWGQGGLPPRRRGARGDRAPLSRPSQTLAAESVDIYYCSPAARAGGAGRGRRGACGRPSVSE